VDGGYHRIFFNACFPTDFNLEFFDDHPIKPMKFVIGGAGSIGQNFMTILEQDFDVVLIEKDPEKAKEMEELYDILSLVGSISDPQMLAHASMDNQTILLGVTDQDDTNIVACQLAHHTFNVALTAARLHWENDDDHKNQEIFKNLGIDMILSPEQLALEDMLNSLEVPGAFDSITLQGGQWHILGIHLTNDNPWLQKPYKLLQESLQSQQGMYLLGAITNDGFLLDHHITHLSAGDSLYCLGKKSSLTKLLDILCVEHAKPKNVLIVGGNLMGRMLAQRLETTTSIRACLIEDDPTLLQQCTIQLENTRLFQGNPLHPEILAEANLQGSDAIIAVTSNDMLNILVSLIAQRWGLHNGLALLNDCQLWSLLTSFGIEKTTSPGRLTSAFLWKNLQKTFLQSLFPISHTNYKLAEITLGSGAYALGMKFPQLSSLGIQPLGLIGPQGFQKESPKGLAQGDCLIAVVTQKSHKLLHKLFQPKKNQ
jgi:trk system potassium uptake protein